MIELPRSIETIVVELRAQGFRPLIVGGAVRDALLGRAAKDIDIEVYGITYDRLAQILSRFGRVDLVGRSFGVVKLDGHDFSVPRRDNKIGRGHRDFLTTFDPSITPREAASRRDFTINAMAYDPVSHEVLDFFGGRGDLQNRVLRATSSAFSEDPLRVLRGMQFACRFDLTVDLATAEMSRAIADQYSTIARERVAEEFMKWATKASHPGRIFEYLEATGWLAHFPELQRLKGVPQDPEWHPEGDVAVHTMHVVDFAARIAERDHCQGDDRAVLMFAALAHDFAKADTTELREKDGRLRWTSYGHEAAAGPAARAFLERIGIKNAIIEQVVALVRHHLAHSSIGPEVTPRAVRRLAARLAPASIMQLIRLIEADASGRPPREPGLPESAARIREVAEAQAVEQKPQSPLILGRDVLPFFDNQAGPHIGEVTRAAYEAQLDGAFSTEEEGRKWLEDYLRRKSNAN
ncbi:MAG TPA: HD domain-containing protein [Bryobacteraceae bacterium]|nr:HD domain-containing protein [Bryobacteraceae bacterium]